MTSPSVMQLDELFEPAAVPRRSWWRRRGALAGAAAVIVAVLVGAFATGAVGSSGPSYRTAVVEERAVGAELTGVATIEPVAQAQVGFPTSGTVASVSVQVGDDVAAGDVLAQLDTKELEQSLRQAQADLADAELTLENGLAGKKATTAPSSGGAGALNASATNGTGESRIVFTAATTDPELQAAQQAVLDAQHAVDVALDAAATAYDNAVAVCVDDGGGGAADPIACQTALADSLAAQTEVQTAQHQLVEASIAYDTLLAERAAAGGGSNGGGSNGGGTAPGPATSEPATSTPSTDLGSVPGGSLSGGGASTSSAPSSSDLIAYQKAVDAAAAEVAVAEQAIEQATITTPIAGTVVAVDLAVGEAVSDAATQNVIVQGGGGFEATTTVGVTDVAHIAVGQKAYVRPDGSDAVLKGSVASISAAPVSSGTSTSYRVTVALDDPDAAQKNGNTGTVSIVTEASARGLAVPTSAVQVTNGRYVVDVLSGGDVTRTAVEVGAVGREWTAVTRGLSAGDVVAIADLDEPLPSSATESTSGSGATGPGGGTFTIPAGGFAPPGR